MASLDPVMYSRRALNSSSVCLPTEFNRASAGFELFGLLYATLNFFLIASGLLLWYWHRDELYLKRRNFYLVLLMVTGWMANTVCGPLYRSSLSNENSFRISCFLVNLTYAVAIPFIAIPQGVRLILFRNQRRLYTLVADLFTLNNAAAANAGNNEKPDDKESMAESKAPSLAFSGWFSTTTDHLEALGYLKFAASEAYGIRLALYGMGTTFLLAIGYAFLSCPTKLFPDQDCTYAGFASFASAALFVLPLVVIIGLHLYVQKQTIGEPDPFGILQEIKLAYLPPALLGVPGLLFATIDIGGFNDARQLKWKWSILVDFAVTAMLVFSIHYQVYKCRKLRESSSGEIDLKLEKVISSETGYGLFEQVSYLVHYGS